METDCKCDETDDVKRKRRKKRGRTWWWAFREEETIVMKTFALLVVFASNAVAVGAEPAPDSGVDGELLDAASHPPLDSALPVILEEPKDSYVIKNKPAALRCRAAHALKLYFVCSDPTKSSTSHPEQSFHDPMTGIRQVEATLEVLRGDVDDSGQDGFGCECIAWNSRGQTKSRVALVTNALLRKHFVEHPYSKSVPLEGEIELRCLPPEGRPPPTTTWLKNDQPLDVDSQLNYKISSVGSLLILSARFSDSANYTCVAENVAARRVSDTAVITVYVDGSWSSWSSWSSCSSKCYRGVQKRTRMCNNPAPMNGGEACHGPAVQKTDCAHVCPAVHGGWTTWSSWSTCGPDCRHHRRRSCSAPTPQHGGQYCTGKDVTSSNCSGGMCRGRGSSVRMLGDNTEEAMQQAVQQDITLIIVLAVLVPLVLLLLVFLFRKLNRKDRRNGSMYEIAASDYPLPFYSDSEKKLKGLQPDLTQGVMGVTPGSGIPLCYDPAYSDPTSTHKSGTTIGYDQHYSNPASTLKSGTITPASEHHYDVPLVRPSSSDYSTPTQQEAAHLILAETQPRLETPPSRERDAHSPLSELEYPGSSLDKPLRSESPRSIHSECTSTPSRPTSTVYSDAHVGRDSILSTVLPAGVDATTGAWGVVTAAGAMLDVPECGVSLTIPEGAVTSGMAQEVYVAILRHPADRPPLNDRQTLLSPVVACGASGGTLQKPAILSFKHSASLQHAAWRFDVYSSKGKPPQVPTDEPLQWERFLTLGEERVDTPVFTQLDGNQVHLMTETLQHFALIGESAGSNAAVKQVRVVPTAPSIAPHGNITIRIYIVQDNMAALAGLIHQEKRSGAALLDKPKVMLVQDCGANICLTLDDLPSGWKVHSGMNYQEIPFERIWNGADNLVHTVFTVERIGEFAGALSCRVLVQQKGSSTHKQLIRINTDFPYAPVTASPTHMPPRSSTVTSSSGCSSLVTLAPETAVFRLPPKLRQELCRCLDPPNARGNDWRMLAARINVDRYLNYFASKTSPTEHILDLWEARHREPTAITDLLNVFRVMGRPDAAAVLEQHTGAWI
ncbi:unc-5 [Oratosquilla oratoria]|uniref:unc-5 n=1 Tax=Oratosquilla oratoria TaxID=337810 RepID=UPI003F760739